MKVDKISISLDPDLGDELREAARKSGKGVSAWVADAVAKRLRAEAFDEFMREWEAEFGVLTEEEIALGAAELGLVPPKSRSKSKAS